MRYTTTIHRATAETGNYQVVDTYYEGRPARMLYGKHKSPQSGLATDDNPELLFDYNQRFLELCVSTTPSRVLIIGGGAFTLPTALYYRFPKAVIDVVEIEPELRVIAETYFEKPIDDSRLRTYVGDGREFAAQTRNRYDMIIIDAFSRFTIPKQLLSSEAVDAYARLLEPGGIITVNFIDWYISRTPTLAHNLVCTYRTSFSNVELYPADPSYPKQDEQNIILVASNRQTHQFDYLQSAVVQPSYTDKLPRVLHD